MAISSPNIGDLLSSIQFRSQAKSNAYSIQNQSLQYQSIEQQEKIQKTSDIANTVLSIASVGAALGGELYQYNKNKKVEEKSTIEAAKKEKNEKDLKSATIGLNQSLTDLTISVNDAINNNEVYIENDEFLLGDNVETKYNSIRENIEKLDYDPEVIESLLTTLDENYNDIKNKALISYHEKLFEDKKAQDINLLNDALKEESANFSSNTYNSVDTVIDSITYLTEQEKQDQKAEAHKQIDLNRAIGGYSQSVLTDGLDVTNQKILNDTRIPQTDSQGNYTDTYLKNAQTLVARKISDAQDKVSYEVSQTLQSLSEDPNNMIKIGNGSYILNFSDIYEQVDDKYSNYAPEIRLAAYSAVQQEQIKQINKSGIFKSTDSMALMQDNELMYYKQILDNVSETGALIGYEDNIDSTKVNISNELTSRAKLQIEQQKQELEKQQQSEENEQDILKLKIETETKTLEDIKNRLQTNEINGTQALEELNLLVSKNPSYDTKIAVENLISSFQDVNTQNILIPARLQKDVTSLLNRMEDRIELEYSYSSTDSVSKQLEMDSKQTELKKYVEGFIIDKMLEYDSSKDPEEFYESLSTKIESAITSKIYDAKGITRRSTFRKLSNLENTVYIDNFGKAADYKFATKEIETNYYASEDYLKDKLNKAGINITELPSMPKIEADGTTVPIPTLKGTDGNWYTINGNTIEILDKENNKWIEL